jgi:hypothetical protein
MDPDMNLQINTLYVGNLPSSPPPPGYGPNHLEDSLRSLFSNQPGYRKLCFRQKSKWADVLRGGLSIFIHL